MSNLFYILLLLILVIGNTTFSVVLSLLDYFHNRKETPKKYDRAKEYMKANIKLGIVSNIFGAVVLLIILFSGVINYIDLFLRRLTSYEPIIGLLFFGLFGGAIFFLDIPFSIYKTFYLEKKYGFNKTKQKTFVNDVIKTIILWIVLGVVGLLPLLWLFNVYGPSIWIYCWLMVSVLQIFALIIFPVWIAPFFNTFKILRDGELKSAIKEYLDSQNIRLDINNLKVEDSSRRSTKSGASLTGLWWNKRIILSDNLIKNHTSEEIVAIVAHEVGHYKKNHIFKKLILYLLESFIMFYLLSLFLKSSGFYLALGVTNHSVHVGLFLMSIVYIPLALAFSIVGNILSRRFELSADAFVAKTSSSYALASALSKLEKDNLVNPTPHPVNVFVNYTHPPIAKRIENLK